MSKKYKVKKIGKVRVAVECKKWETPMKPRVPRTITHSDPRWPSRSEDKRELLHILRSSSSVEQKGDVFRNL